MFSKISQNPQKNTSTRVSFLIKLQVETCNFIKKETLAQTFSCKFWKICKSIYFYRTPLVNASDNRYFWEKIRSSIYEIQIEVKNGHLRWHWVMLTAFADSVIRRLGHGIQCDCPWWSWYECRGQSRHLDTPSYIVPAGQAARDQNKIDYLLNKCLRYHISIT